MTETCVWGTGLTAGQSAVPPSMIRTDSILICQSLPFSRGIIVSYGLTARSQIGTSSTMPIQKLPRL